MVCGQVWSPYIKSGGRLARKGWLCPNGCKAKDKRKSKLTKQRDLKKLRGDKINYENEF